MTTGEDQTSELPINERRRAIFERAVERYRLAGTPIDTDANFVRLINEWIEGTIEMIDVARRASPADRRRTEKLEDVGRPSASSGAAAISQDDLLSELNRIIGLHDLKSD